MGRVLVTIALAVLASLATARDYSLTAPERAHSRQQIEVGWTAPQDDGGLLEIRTNLETTSRANYAYVRANPQKIEAPEAPGDYVIVFVHEREVKASRPLTVFLPEASLAAPAEVGAREDFAVTWSGPNNSRDHITFAERGGAPVRGASYAYVGNSKDGKVKLQAPEAAGEYDLIYLTGKTVLARAPVTVGAVTATLEAPAQVGANEDFDVTWTGPDNSQDHITFAERGGAPVRGASYAYVGNSKDGKVKLRAPADAGEYDVIYQTGSTVLARTPVTVTAISATLDAPAQIHAGGQVRVTWDGPRNAQDYIGFAERDGEYIRGSSYEYVSNVDDNAVVINAREEVGPVDVVYVSGDRVIGRTSLEIVPAHIDLEAPDEVTALDEFTVIWQGLGNRGDQIHALDNNGERLAYTYIVPDKPEARLVAPAEPGKLDLVYITREGRELARHPITVLPAPEKPSTLTVLQSGSGLGPDDGVAVIFDASGSMLQRIGSERRVEIARQTLSALVADTLPEGTGFALRVFGHKEPGACRTDLEIPLAPLNRTKASGVIGAINAMNLARTPLGHSIELAASDLANVKGQRILVLLTDGEETCDGDPAAAINMLRDKGWDIRVNIVGFAIDDPALRQTFAAWASLGGGAYFNASDRDELGAALVEAVASNFTVVNGGGDTLARGRAGDTIDLPAGEYRVQWRGGETPAVVPAGSSVTVTLE